MVIPGTRPLRFVEIVGIERSVVAASVAFALLAILLIVWLVQSLADASSTDEQDAEPLRPPTLQAPPRILR